MMGKIVKYCADCEEGFAEKFSFCPNCAAPLTAYEMNPANPGEVLKVAEPVPVEEPPAAAVTEEKIEAAPPIVEKPIESAPATQNFSVKDEDINLLDDDDFISDEKPVVEAETPAPEAAVFTPAVTENADSQSFNNPTVNSFESPKEEYRKPVVTNTLKAQDGLYHITFVEEKNASGRNLLLLGAFLLVTATVFGGIVYSLFAQSPYIGSLTDNDVLVAYTDNNAPEEVKPDLPEPKKKDEGGGGGGGGQQEKTPTPKGVLATQTEKPLIAPDVNAVRAKADLQEIISTQGKRKETPSDQPYGDPNSKFNVASNGTGSGSGQGSGRGSGQGSGVGTGAGSGVGSGNGSGRGNGNGGGEGDGDNPPKILVKPPPPVVEPFKIISKPRPNYTDPARQNQVSGVVRLKVTFLASGSIGSVTALNTLPYGLTEQAIAAAKQIRFEPAKSNGAPTTVTKTIEYTFNIF